MDKIVVSGVTKEYKNVIALNNVSFEILPNKIYGLLGRNGAGKSTLIKTIGNKIFQNEGEITVDELSNINNAEVLEKIIIMNEDNYVPYKKLGKVFEQIKMFKPNFDLEYALELSKVFGLNLKKKFMELSTGYKSIFKFILAMCSSGKYIFLDEPVLGLDATHRELVYKIILEYQLKNECTIVISTHIIEEVANIIEDVIIINNGEIIVSGNKDDFTTDYYSANGAKSAVEEFCIGKKVISKESLGGLMSACIKGEIPEKSVPNINFESATLQQIFVTITKNEEEISYENKTQNI